MSVIIVTRHKGAAEWLAKRFSFEGYSGHWYVEYDSGKPVRMRTDWQRPEEYITGPAPWESPIPIMAEVTADDVRGKEVYGNLPFHLARLTRVVHAIEFDGAPPRGAEYTAEDMAAAGARVQDYIVLDNFAFRSIPSDTLAMAQDASTRKVIRRTYRIAQGCAYPKKGDKIGDETVVAVLPPSDCDGGAYVTEGP